VHNVDVEPLAIRRDHEFAADPLAWLVVHSSAYRSASRGGANIIHLGTRDATLGEELRREPLSFGNALDLDGDCVDRLLYLRQTSIETS
jgi:hypothetical protein